MIVIVRANTDPPQTATHWWTVWGITTYWNRNNIRQQPGFNMPHWLNP